MRNNVPGPWRKPTKEEKEFAAQRREAAQKLLESNMAIAQILTGGDASGLTRAAADKGAAFTAERIARSLEFFCGAGAPENPRLVEGLLAHPKCEVDRASDGGTPLYVAARAGRAALVRALLAKGANPNKGFQGDFPLHAAARWGTPEVVSALLEAGASQAAESVEGGVRPLHVAAELGREAELAALVAKAGPGELDARSRAGRTALSLAVAAGSLACVRALLEGGADPNAADATEDRNTPLHWAVARGDQGVGEALIAAAASTEARNAKGLSPLEMTDSEKLRFALKQAAGSRDVMISYSHQPAEVAAFARALRDALQAQRITVWLDEMAPSGIEAGTEWRSRIAQGIDGAAAVVFIASELSVASDWCRKELAYARQTETAIFPVWREKVPLDAELEAMLFSRQFVDFSGARPGDAASFAAPLAALASGLRDALFARRGPRTGPGPVKQEEEAPASSTSASGPPPAVGGPEASRGRGRGGPGGAVGAAGAVVALLSARSAAARPLRDALALAENRRTRLLPLLLPDFQLPPALAYSFSNSLLVGFAENCGLDAAAGHVLSQMQGAPGAPGPPSNSGPTGPGDHGKPEFEGAG
eukprot:tig00021680_g23050.t1